MNKQKIFHQEIRKSTQFKPVHVYVHKICRQFSNAAYIVLYEVFYKYIFLQSFNINERQYSICDLHWMDLPTMIYNNIVSISHSTDTTEL
jgi:hypothetical protein